MFFLHTKKSFPLVSFHFVTWYKIPRFLLKVNRSAFNYVQFFVINSTFINSNRCNISISEEIVFIRPLSFITFISIALNSTEIFQHRKETISKYVYKDLSCLHSIELIVLWWKLTLISEYDTYFCMWTK